MADTESRNSIFFVALASLIFISAMACLGVVHHWRNDAESRRFSFDAPQPAASAAPAPAAQLAAAGEEPAGPTGAGCGTDGPLRMDHPVRVHIAGCRHPLRLRLGNLVISTMWRAPQGRDQGIETVVNARRRGQRGQTMLLRAAIDVGLLFDIGTLDRAGHRYLMVQSFGEGPQVSVDLAVPEGPDRGVVNLGVVEMTMLDQLDLGPSDIDGDGRTDFILRDNRFFHDFDAYGGIAPPPLRIWNIRRGRAIDVSAEPRFQFAFRQDLGQRRADCLGGGDEVRSSCPEYVATAARLGRFRSAWRAMMRGDASCMTPE